MVTAVAGHHSRIAIPRHFLRRSKSSMMAPPFEGNSLRQDVDNQAGQQTGNQDDDSPCEAALPEFLLRRRAFEDGHESRHLKYLIRPGAETNQLQRASLFSDFHTRRYQFTEAA